MLGAQHPGAGLLLVGVDGSAASGAAALWALRRAQALGHEVTLVHCVPEDWATRDRAQAAEMMEASRGLLRSEAARAKNLAPSVTVNTALHRGEAADVLSALSPGADLVVIGTDRAGSTHGEDAGVVSLQIATLSRSPVAVIPVVSLRGRSGVVVGVDGSIESAAAITFAAAEAARLGQDLLAVYAGATTGRQGQDLLTDTATTIRQDHPDLVVRLQSPAPNVQVPRSTSAELVHAARNSRLLVVGSRGRDAVKRVQIGTVGYEVLQQIQCPTVVVRMTEQSVE
ncbi:universal stress protein [Paeniglutamicibacter antarcticus]|uniref:Universal stress protein n=1 Tax=Arthrobacter terrae TaxID=2935737 RepID=A0A931CRD2_9MICC|nr:universal stress protein [Arthrobacter terrae]MBG0739599.1 universal stress protein [Arthrobacter terrae]